MSRLSPVHPSLAGSLTPARPPARCDYTDQPNLTRDFRDFTDVTPVAFRGGHDDPARLFAGLLVDA